MGGMTSYDFRVSIEASYDVGHSKTYHQVFHGLDIFLRSFGSLCVGIIELQRTGEEAAAHMRVSHGHRHGIQKDDSRSRRVPIATPATVLHLPNKPWLNLAATDWLHHGEMLKIVMSLEKGVTGIEFNQDTANAPDVTGIAPAQVEDDFRCAVMPRRDDRRVILIVECRRAKVNQPNLCIEQHLPVSFSSSDGRG